MSESSELFVALRHRNFRLLWGGQLVSMAGTLMQSAAILWHVSLLVPPNQRGIALGLVGLVRLLPIVVLFFQSAPSASSATGVESEHSLILFSVSQSTSFCGCRRSISGII